MRPWEHLEEQGGGRGLRCLPLVEAGIGHVFTLRPAPGSLPGDVARERLLAAAGFPGGRLLLPRQVHGAGVAFPEPGGDLRPREADAVAVGRTGVAAAVGTADCAGAVLAHPGGPAFAVIHAGWRGVLAGVVEAAVEGLRSLAGPGPMILATGPSARRCCYQVDEDVAGPFRERFRGEAARKIFGRRDGKVTVDPAAAVRAQAVSAGIRPEGVHDAGICTMCRPDLCWSFRIQGREAGRMWAAAWIPPVSP